MLVRIGVVHIGNCHVFQIQDIPGDLFVTDKTWNAYVFLFQTNYQECQVSWNTFDNSYVHAPYPNHFFVVSGAYSTICNV